MRNWRRYLAFQLERLEAMRAVSAELMARDASRARTSVLRAARARTVVVTTARPLHEALAACST